ncbi:MAG: hypothetical protein HFH46_02940 [Bacilli bacterium]|nr:hypothetical protein [Bacilli bacterium]
MDNKNVETLEIVDTNNTMEISEPNKKNRTKLIIFLIVLIVVIGACVYFYVLDKNNTKQLEKAMEDASINYYENYINTNTGAGAYDVTLEMLKDANANSGENYKLDALDRCNVKTTKAIITIDYVSGEVTGTKINLDCKKF